MSEELISETLTGIKLVVGLGNPGAKYAGTRHNIGFMVIDKLLESEAIKVYKRANSEVAELLIGDRKVIFQKPLSYMNSSGEPVQKLCRRHEIKPNEVLVVYDDLDLATGRLRIRFGGSSGGHNGIKSMIARLGTADFGRLKIGIGRTGSSEDVADYVLSEFSLKESELMKEVIATSVKAILMLCNEGYGAAMNTYNGKTIGCSSQPSQE